MNFYFIQFLLFIYNPLILLASINILNIYYRTSKLIKTKLLGPEDPVEVV